MMTLYALILAAPVYMSFGILMAILLLAMRPATLKNGLRIIAWGDSKLREYWLPPHKARGWIETMRERGYELYTLIPPNGEQKLAMLMFHRVRKGRGPYNRLDYTRDWLSL